MKIDELHLQNFGVYTDSTYTLSPGVTLITAANGKGKTTLASGLTWLLWGKLIRPLDLERGASVSGVLSGGAGSGPLTLRRRITSQGELVDFDGHFQNSNKTRAAETLQPLYGRWESWKRSLHVTGRTAAVFSLGTPRDKLEHLVAITGADKFDLALEKQKQAASSALAAVATARATLRSSEALWEREAVALSTIATRHTFIRSLYSADNPRLLYEECDARVVRGTQISADLERRATGLFQLETQYSGLLRRAKADAQRSGSRVCSSCGSTVASPQDKELMLCAAEYEALRELAWAEAQSVSAKRNRVSERLTKEIELRGSLYAKVREVEQREAALRDVEEQTLGAFHAALNTAFRVNDALAAVRAAEATADNIVRAKAVLTGARSSYLRRYTNNIQAFANYYLEQVGSSLRLLLEYAQGRLVVTTKGGYEYTSLSGGEQRRIDLCLILAMSQVAAAVGTVPASAPLIIDEAFDTLDSDGVAALIYLACVVAQRRQVLLISHAEPELPKDANIWHIKL